METLLSPSLSAENALQLHFGPAADEPTIGSTSFCSTNAIVTRSDSNKDEGAADGSHNTIPIPEYEIGLPAGVQSLRVRFRSRVRIGSGIHKGTGGRYSAGSSPSSSISAPLRYQTDMDDSENSPHEDEGSAPVPHDDRFDAATAHLLQRHMMSPRVRRRRKKPSWSVDERSPLMSHTSRPRSYIRSRSDSDDEDSHDMQCQMLRRKIQEDAIFGKWPGRLLNRHVCILS